jgi:hypothetical protein
MLTKKIRILIKNILIVSVFFSILFFVVFVVADEPVKGTRGIPAIKNLGKEWTITKQTGAESNFNVIFADVKNKSTDICFVLKDGINPSSVDLTDKLIYSQDGSLILDDKNKPIALKYETAKCLVNGTMRKGYHILLTDAQAVNINGYIQLGSNTIVLVYQEQKLINYQTDFGEINVSLSCENVNQNDIWIFDRTENYKFGANGTFEGLKNCTYSIVSSTKLSRNGNLVYVTSPYTINVNEHEKHIISFDDICNKNYEPYLVFENRTIYNETTGEELYNETYNYTAYNYSSNCQFNSINKYITEVRFLTNNSIDPEFDNIIEIVSAEHLLNNYTFVSDIYEEVRARDDIWSEVIPVDDYVRVTFNRSINSGKQISIYVRSNGTASVEFYEKGESNLITRVDDIHEDKMYHVYLTDLIGEQDTFDLKVLGDDVEFDYILDDDTVAPNISFVGNTPASGSSQSGTSIIVNVSSADDNGEHFVTTNFDNSLVGWWRMDDTNSSGDVVDYMGRNNGSKVGGVVINSSSGRFGNGSWFDGVNDYILFNNSKLPRVNNSFSFSAWLNPNPNSGNKVIYVSGSLGNQYWYLRLDSSNRLIFHKYAGTGYTATKGFISDDGWHYAVVTYDELNNNLSFYVNGSYKSSSTPESFNTSIGSSYLGRDVPQADNLPWNGTIDEVMIFNRSLSLAEIKALYNASANKYYNNFTSLSEGTHTFKSYAVDVAGNLNSTETRSVTITAGGDTCTYGGSGIWALDCSNNCVFTTTQTIANQDNVTITGSGVLNFSNNGKWSFSGSSQYVTVGSGCTLNINPGGGWSY